MFAMGKKLNDHIFPLPSNLEGTATDMKPAPASSETSQAEASPSSSSSAEEKEAVASSEKQSWIKSNNRSTIASRLTTWGR